MSVDIRDLLHDAATEDAPDLDVDALWSRGRRQDRLRSGLTVAAVTALLVGGGIVLAGVGTDGPPAIIDQPVEDEDPTPGAEATAVEYPVGLADLFTPATTGRDRVVARFPEGDGVAEISRDEKLVGPHSLAGFQPCASGSVCTEDAYTGFGFLDHANDRVLLHNVGSGGVRVIDLERFGYRVPGSLLLHSTAAQPVAFVTVARDIEGRGVGRVLAIDLETEELLADVAHPAEVGNPALRYGTPSESDDQARSLWVQDGDSWRAVLQEAREPSTNRVAFTGAIEGPTSTQAPVDAKTRAGLRWTGTDIAVSWDLGDTTWDFPEEVFVRAAHPTYDGLLAVVGRTDSDDNRLVRLRAGEVVDVAALDSGAMLGGNSPEFHFQPDGTLLVLADASDGAATVTAYRPIRYARTSPFVGGAPGTLRMIGGKAAVLSECYVSPTSDAPRAICAAQRSVEEGGAVALVEAAIDVDGRAAEDELRIVAELPGTERADLVGARWAEVGGPFVHLGVKADGELFIYELDTDTLRPAGEGEFTSAR